MEYDVAIVGAGPAGLSAAIRLAQCAKTRGHPLKIAVLEKGKTVGAHILSGAVFEPRALNELIPNWQELKAPLHTKATLDEFILLSKQHSMLLPTPPQMRNKGNFIISLGVFCRWLAAIAENLGVDIFPGYPASEALFDEKGKVCGVRTQEVGLTKQGEKKPNYQPGVEIKARYTLLAEGCRGSLTKTIEERFHLRGALKPQTYGIGIKELWEILPDKHQAGKITHTLGWPLDHNTYGGSFIYHFEKNLLSIGFVVGLDYQNPYLDPFEEFQRFKLHPKIRPLLEGGRRISYGARALNEGGFQAIPTLTFPGGALIGCAAGFLNVPKIKGSHTAMKSGMLAAEALFDEFLAKQSPNTTTAQISYPKRIQNSWIWEELKRARNIRPAFRWGLLPGLFYAALDTYLFRGRAPWTFRHSADNLSLKKATQCTRIHYPKPDGVITFDKSTSAQLSNIYYAENQPNHLHLKDPSVPIRINLPLYDAPEQRYCPTEVYEILMHGETKAPYLQINAQNCIQCKTCDIKDPTQNITWVPPEGGDGPNYSNM